MHYNTHVHTHNSHDSSASIEELYKNAEKEGLYGFSVTDHCDCEFASSAVRQAVLNSFDEVQQYKEITQGKLLLTAGTEIGEALFAPEFASEIISSRPWDVINGSVHAVRINKYDMPFSTIDFSGKSDIFIEAYLTQYFDDVLEMLRTQDFDILCHLTVPLRYIQKKYHKTVDLEKYDKQLNNILKETVQRGKVLEINTSDFCSSDAFYMPDERITDMYISLGGKYFSVGSDAHVPNNIGKGILEAEGMLRKKGVKELYYFINRKPVAYPL